MTIKTQHENPPKRIHLHRALNVGMALVDVGVLLIFLVALLYPLPN